MSERHLAGNQKKLSRDSAWKLKPLPRDHGAPGDRFTREHCENAVLSECCERRCGGKEREAMPFPESQQSSNLVDLGPGEHNGFDGTPARCDSRMEFRALSDLLGKIRRSIEQDPGVEAGLRAGAYPRTPSQANRHTGQR